MNTIITLSTVLALSTFFANAEPITPEEKNDFVDYYRDRVRLLLEFPESPQVKAIFVDLDGDGREEALATSRVSTYEDGNDWAAFRRIGDQWESIKGFDNDAKMVRPGSGVFARSGEIFRVVGHEGKTDFLVLHENFDKVAPDGLGPLYKTRFSIDKEGVLQQESIENLERYLAYSGANRSGLVSSLEALKVEHFAGDGLAKNKEQKAQHPTDGAVEPEKPKD